MSHSGCCWTSNHAAGAELAMFCPSGLPRQFYTLGCHACPIFTSQVPASPRLHGVMHPGVITANKIWPLHAASGSLHAEPRQGCYCRLAVQANANIGSCSKLIETPTQKAHCLRG